ncbi:MAG: DUF1343 domain-containing protein [Thermoflexales bacterium]|jgi:uncharacterized protein YbbC (DUF1343 family)|nr:DUF1343 domain-containing protein [Thermoflexales bacterium]
MSTRPGIDTLLADSARLIGRRIGIVTNQTGFTGDARQSTVDALAALPGVTLAALFGPEHGVRGDVQDALAIDHSIDAATGAPVYSLYGETKQPKPEWLKAIDLLIYDIQDVGCRYYTYLNTLGYMMQAAEAQGIEMLVLDRPNPINGLDVEGPILASGISSFVGMYPIPVRHGLTIGELALFLRDTRYPGCSVDVSRMTGWRRHFYFDDTGLPWFTPSPNLPTLDCAVIYPGLCLFEGTNLSEARGTTHPFEWFGAPWVDAPALARDLNSRNIPGAAFRPVYFEPTYSKHLGVRCAGIQTHVTDRALFKPFSAGLHAVDAVMRLHPDDFAFLPASWEGRNPHFDLLSGDARIREGLIARAPIAETIALDAADQDDWRKRKKRWHLY